MESFTKKTNILTHHLMMTYSIGVGIGTQISGW